jgi:hypothetical protein
MSGQDLVSTAVSVSLLVAMYVIGTTRLLGLALGPSRLTLPRGFGWVLLNNPPPDRSKRWALVDDTLISALPLTPALVVALSSSAMPTWLVVQLAAMLAWTVVLALIGWRCARPKPRG